MTKDTLIGVMLCVLGAMSLAVMGTFIKLIGNHVDEAFVLFSRFFISMVITLPFAMRESKDGVKITNWTLLLVRSIFGLGAMACFFYAISHMPLADAVLLVNTAPAFVPIVLFVMFRTRTRLIVWIGIFISLLGVLCVMRPGSGLFHPAAIIGAIGGLGAAIATVCLRRMMSNGKNGPHTTLLFYFTITSIIAFFFSFEGWKTPHGIDWFYLLMVGIFGALFQFALTFATRYAQIRVVSPTLLSTVIFSGIVDWGFWGQVPSVYSLAGAGFVVVGIIIVVMTNR